MLFRFAPLVVIVAFGIFTIARGQRRLDVSDASANPQQNSSVSLVQQPAIRPIPLRGQGEEAELPATDLAPLPSGPMLADDASHAIPESEHVTGASRWQDAPGAPEPITDSQSPLELTDPEPEATADADASRTTEADQPYELGELEPAVNRAPPEESSAPHDTSPTALPPTSGAQSYGDADNDAQPDFDSQNATAQHEVEPIAADQEQEDEFPTVLPPRPPNAEPEANSEAIEELPPPNPQAGPLLNEPPSADPPPMFRSSSQTGVTADETGPMVLPPTTSALDQPEAAGQLESEATGKPGPAELEGPQTPTLTVEKMAPAEIRVGVPAKFMIKVRNRGEVSADQVLLRDEIPHGTRLVATVPQANRLSDGAIMWQMGTIKPGEEVTATMELMPVAEGEVGSVATISLQASASARTLATRPQLVIEQSAPRQVRIGEDVELSIRLSNPGSGSATSVVLKEDVPDGLKHAAGRELEYEVGTLKPAETQQFPLTLLAEKPGKIENVLLARADGNLEVHHRLQMEVVAPELQVEIDGPNRRYLNREFALTIALRNPGTAPAKEVELVAHLPRALKFVNANNAGYYDQSSHSVRWSLEELPAKEAGMVRVTVLPTEITQQKLRAEAKAQLGLAHAVEKEVSIEGLAALLFTLADVTDPIEVGGQTTYEIRVVNQGSTAATNVRVVAAVPAGMRAIGGDGPTQVVLEPHRVGFEPLPRLAPQTDATFKIHVYGEQPGDKRFRVLLSSDEMRDPVTKEESTHVYSDQ